jgi:hypothetical protein
MPDKSKKKFSPILNWTMSPSVFLTPGASPGEVERGVILAVEEAVQGLDGIKEVTAAADEGIGQVTVEIIEGKDIRAPGPGHSKPRWIASLLFPTRPKIRR